MCVGGEGCKMSYVWDGKKEAINPAHTEQLMKCTAY